MSNMFFLHKKFDLFMSKINTLDRASLNSCLRNNIHYDICYYLSKLSVILLYNDPITRVIFINQHC